MQSVYVYVFQKMPTMQKNRVSAVRMAGIFKMNLFHWFIAITLPSSDCQPGKPKTSKQAGAVVHTTPRLHLHLSSW